MPIFVSHFSASDSIILDNHKAYCERYGYPHEYVGPAIEHAVCIEGANRYAVIREHLSRVQTGDWLIYLDQDCMIYRPDSVENLLQDRDHLLPQLMGRGDGLHHPFKGMMVWRNTPANQDLLFKLDLAKGREFGASAALPDEHSLLKAAGLLQLHEVKGNRVVLVSSAIVNWQDVDIFVVYLGALVSEKTSEAFSYTQLNKKLLAPRIGRYFKDGVHVFERNTYPSPVSDTLHMGENAKIAFVCIYTPEVADYAVICEQNARRYCERHGYGLHLYRQTPADAPSGMSPNWLKSWLLLQHIEQHDWVIWIDADIIFLNQAKRFENLLEDRDVVVARDIQSWVFNSGVMAYRNTEANRKALADIHETILNVHDKSSVYASNGDQYYFNEYFMNNGLSNSTNVISYMSLNTHPAFATETTLLVHFMGLGSPHRACWMDDYEQLSLALDERG